MDPFYKSKHFLIGALVVLAIAVPVNNRKFGKVKTNQDIYFIYSDARTISEGDNPYLRTLDGDMKNNDKYSTYFPLFYEAGALVIKLGFRDFKPWLKVVQIIMAFFIVGCGFMIFHMLRKNTDILLAIFFTLFFFFHRWIINISIIAHIDLIAIFFLLLSLSFLNKDFKKALIWFGVSLAVKQIAIFMAPLYLVWAWQRKPSWKYLGQSTLYASIVPLIASLPFIVWNFKAFLMSIFFSATRLPASHLDSKSIDAMVGIHGLVAKLPMLVLIAFTCYLAFKKKIGPFTSAFLIMAVFIGFNSVFFRQYFGWTVALFPLVLIDQYPFKKSNTPETQPIELD